MDTKELLSSAYSDNREKMRSQSEVTARYNLCCQKYKELKNCRAEIREQKVMVYAELRVLGWVLGKTEQTITRDANF